MKLCITSGDNYNTYMYVCNYHNIYMRYLQDFKDVECKRDCYFTKQTKCEVPSNPKATITFGRVRQKRKTMDRVIIFLQV